MPSDLPTYSIKDWGKAFETYESRKIKQGLNWVALPTKQDGKGYRRLSRHPQNVAVFCAFCLIVEVAAKMPIRGILADDDGPLTAFDLSDKTGFPKEIFDLAFEVLSDDAQGIKWLISDKKHVIRCNHSGQQGTGQDRTGQDRTNITGHTGARLVRLHGIPETVEDVINYGKTTAPIKDENTCREFWAHYEGQARTNPSGELFWVTSGDSVVTNWKVKLSAFGKLHENKNDNQIGGGPRSGGRQETEADKRRRLCAHGRPEESARAILDKRREIEDRKERERAARESAAKNIHASGSTANPTASQ